MGTPERGRRRDTRQRIQDVALELFVEQGYEKTSLREIADRLEVTKAALYYHFKTKEDILIGIVDDLGRPAEELIDWAKEQPRTMDTKRELLRRYGEAMADAAPLFRFFQENQASIRDLNIGERFRERLLTLGELLADEHWKVADQLRSRLALFAMHGHKFVLQNLDVSEEEKAAAAQEVAFELISQAAAGY